MKYAKTKSFKGWDATVIPMTLFPPALNKQENLINTLKQPVNKQKCSNDISMLNNCGKQERLHPLIKTNVPLYFWSSFSAPFLFLVFSLHPFSLQSYCVDREMGACATKPRELKEEGEAPLPLAEPAEITDVKAEEKEDDNKRTLGKLFKEVRCSVLMCIYVSAKIDIFRSFI